MRFLFFILFALLQLVEPAAMADDENQNTLLDLVNFSSNSGAINYLNFKALENVENRQFYLDSLNKSEIGSIHSIIPIELMEEVMLYGYYKISEIEKDTKKIDIEGNTNILMSSQKYQLERISCYWIRINTSKNQSSELVMNLLDEKKILQVKDSDRQTSYFVKAFDTDLICMVSSKSELSIIETMYRENGEDLNQEENLFDSFDISGCYFWSIQFVNGHRNAMHQFALKNEDEGVAATNPYNSHNEIKGPDKALAKFQILPQAIKETMIYSFENFEDAKAHVEQRREREKQLQEILKGNDNEEKIEAPVIIQDGKTVITTRMISTKPKK